MTPDIFFIIGRTKRNIFFPHSCLLHILLIFLCVFISACDKEADNPNPRREVSVYSERAITAASPYRLNMECDYGNLEFYNWDGKDVKFEITHKVRAARAPEELDKMLERFSIKVSEEKGSVNFNCSYNGKEGNYQDTFTVIRVFMPERTGLIECRLSQGKLAFLDDLDCDLKLDVGKVEVLVNSLRGALYYTGDTGNIRISSGVIKSNSSIITKNGNIRIRSDFESPGSYILNTGAGIISLDIPEALNAIFESNGRISNDEDIKDEASSKFLLKCGIGKININRF